MYEAEAFVLWSDDLIGGVLCDKNLQYGNLHFFFDGRTVIDGETLAVRLSSGKPRLLPGVKVF